MILFIQYALLLVALVVLVCTARYDYKFGNSVASTLIVVTVIVQVLFAELNILLVVLCLFGFIAWAGALLWVYDTRLVSHDESERRAIIIDTSISVIVLAIAVVLQILYIKGVFGWRIYKKDSTSHLTLGWLFKSI